MTAAGKPPIIAPWFLYVLLVMSIATNAVLLTRMKFPDQWAALQDTLHPVPQVTPKDRITGNSRSGVTVIEYADFECPFCADMHKAMEQLTRNGDVKWVYRHYPLLGAHPRALAAAEASECAGDQGKFWEYAASLYQAQDSLTSLVLDRIAARLQLDAGLFRTCMRSGKYTEVVSRHIREGEKLRITGTPTYFINGRRFEGFRSEAALRNAIQGRL